MRKAQKARLLEILRTLREAHKAIKKYVNRCELEMAHALLSECQQGAIQIGELIEESEGEDSPAVRSLEEYCEQLYQISEGISGKITAQNAAKRLHKALSQVENSIRNDIAVQTEVVFLPYKASMWDSLESVWRAANADPNCDAYVIPIPYYDKNPDGSLGTRHYEGALYPKDVPVVQYDSYDFEKRRPDVVFIHNGYDDCNYVTSIHPDYYSHRIKKFAGLLIYIPYFISANSVSEGMCTVPGCWNADRVFVQSEKIRGEYIHAFQNLEFPEGSQADLRLLGEKFVALGSPKFDKAICDQPENYDLPEEWRRLIENPDGSKRKIVLYNTSLSAMLRENEHYLEKLRWVLDTFRKSDQMVLWWRPHPLSESTYQSMRPHLLPEYMQIVHAYRQGGWGIFDNTADVNRAVAYADCYYGDAGSALQASFQATGKPVMIQRVIPASGICPTPFILGMDKQKLYFSPLQSSAVLLMDISTREITAVRPGHSTLLRPYRLGVRTEKALYFTPVDSDAILKLDVASQQFSTIPYELDVDRLLRISPQYQRGGNFIWSFLYGEEVFFVGSYPAIMCLNTRSGQITYAADWPAAFRASDASVVTCCCQMEGQLVLGGDSSVIVYFDLESKSFSAEELRHKRAANGFSTASYGDGYLWLMARDNGTILRFDPLTKEFAVYDQFPVGVLRCETMCIVSAYIHGSLWLFSYNTNAVLRLCAETGEMSAVRIFPSAKKGEAMHLGQPMLADGKLYVSRLSHPEITIYDPETSAYVDIPVQVSVETAKTAVRDGTEYAPKDIHDTVILENGIDTIATLTNTTARDYNGLIAEWIASPDGRAGERIYQYVKDMVLSDQT